MEMRSGYRYSRWDGTQVGFDLDADSLFGEILDDLAYHGDVNAALRRMLQSGFRDRNGERLEGLRELLQRVRDRRREELGRYDLGGAFEEIARKLDEIVEMEQRGIERRESEARASGDRRRQEIIEDLASERRRSLERLPPDLAGRVRELSSYDFMDDEARRRFEELADELRRQLLQTTFNQLAEGLGNMSPEDLARMKDMFAELNQMLAARARGEEPDFAGFMSRYGDFFPGNPQTLDELLEQMARSLAQMESLLQSMTPEQRAQLRQLAGTLLEDLDLNWQVGELGRKLQELFPDLPWNRSMQFSGNEPLELGQMAGLLDTLDDLDQLENLLQSTTQPAQLAEADLDRVRELLGDDAAKSLDQLAELAKMLEEAGLIDQKEGRYELTPRGVRKIGERALADLFEKLARDRFGGHELDRAGIGHERTFELKPYAFGDPFNLDVNQTIRNAMRRQGPGTPVKLSPEDFEIEQTELLTRTATILMLDLSLSMPMRDNFLPAKKMAMALHALITSRFPRDYLGIVAFSEVAREVKPEQLPEVSWDFVYGTNMQHGLLLARRALSRQTGTKQIIMVTDGEPTAHLEGGEVFFSYPPTARTIESTLAEVMRCTRDGIRINTFMLDESYYVQGFVERMTQINRGRAFYTNAESLGGYVLVDFLEQRRARRRHAS